MAAQTCSGPAAGAAGLKHRAEVMNCMRRMCVCVSCQVSWLEGRGQGLPMHCSWTHKEQCRHASSARATCMVVHQLASSCAPTSKL